MLVRKLMFLSQYNTSYSNCYWKKSFLGFSKDVTFHKTNYIYKHVQKIGEKLRKLRKSCNPKRNINGKYNEQMH